MAKDYLNKEGLTTYNRAIKQKLNILNNNDIKEFKTATPFSDGLTVLNAVTNGGTNIEAVDIYNGVDAKYPNAAAGAKVVKELNDKIVNVDKKVTNDKYSTSEVETNEIWIDGKRLYRRVYLINCSTNISVNQPLEIPNYDTIFIDVGHSYTFSGGTFVLPICQYGSSSDYSRVHINKNSRTLVVTFGGTYSTIDKTVYVTVYYTKQ